MSVDLYLGTLYGSDASSYYLDSGDWNGQSSYHSFGTPQPPTPQPVQPSPVSVSSVVSGPVGAVSASPVYLDSIYENSPMISSLPPMSSFRAQAAQSVTHPSVPPTHPTVSPSSVFVSPTGTSTAGSSPSLTTQSGEAIGKALGSIYSSGAGVATADHTPSSYSGSTSSTPVSSPQTWPSRLTTTTSSVPFANTTDATDAHLHTLVSHRPFDPILRHWLHESNVCFVLPLCMTDIDLVWFDFWFDLIAIRLRWMHWTHPLCNAWDGTAIGTNRWPVRRCHSFASRSRRGMSPTVQLDLFLFCSNECQSEPQMSHSLTQSYVFSTLVVLWVSVLTMLSTYCVITQRGRPTITHPTSLSSRVMW